ncbi:MAG: peptidylprolyl isomerase [Bacilli bacterium]|nr:peptidylprolyl isomerase [Bacilli bacterium]
MKYKFLSLLIIVFLSVNINAASIDNGDKEAINVNGTAITNQEIYDELINTGSYTDILNVLDYKAMNAQYEKDSRLPALIEKYYQEAIKDNNVTELYNLAGVKTKEEYIEQAGIKLKALQELAAMDTAYDKIFTKEQKDYVLNNRLSGTITIYHILIAPEVKLSDSGNDSVINQAKQDANKKAEEVIQKLNSGTKFSDAVKTYSDDKTNNDGKIGTYTIMEANKAKLDPNIIKAAFSLKDKTYTTQPIDTKYGYEIIYVEVNKAKPTGDEAKNDVARILYDMYTGNNPYTEQYALSLYRRANDLSISDNMLSKQYATSNLSTKSYFVTYDPSQAYSQYGY